VHLLGEEKLIELSPAPRWDQDSLNKKKKRRSEDRCALFGGGKKKKAVGAYSGEKMKTLNAPEHPQSIKKQAREEGDKVFVGHLVKTNDARESAR